MTQPQEPDNSDSIEPGVLTEADAVEFELTEGHLVERALPGDELVGDTIDVGSSEVGSSVVAAAARGGGKAKPIANLDEADLADRTQDVQFKKIYGNTILRLVTGQLVAANVVFIGYAFAQGWKFEGYVMASWLSATVVQVIGLTWIVVRSLFPPEPPRPRQNTA